MSVPHSSTANWPIVPGSEHEWNPPSSVGIKSRIIAVDGDYVTHRHIGSSGKLYDPVTLPVSAYRMGYLPKDQSPIPALVYALKAIQFKGHNQVCPICKGTKNIGHGAMCDIKLALALAGESGGEETT